MGPLKVTAVSRVLKCFLEDSALSLIYWPSASLPIVSIRPFRPFSRPESAKIVPIDSSVSHPNSASLPPHHLTPHVTSDVKCSSSECWSSFKFRNPCCRRDCSHKWLLCYHFIAVIRFMTLSLPYEAPGIDNLLFFHNLSIIYFC